MKIRECVFGSGSEKELFATLEFHWAQKFDLFPSLPFASIIDFEDAGPSGSEKSFLYKTSVDYTLCTKMGKPLVSVEFDGMCRGFNRAGQFVQVHPDRRDPNRKWKLDFKLRLCREVNYPFFVVSYQEKNPIGEDTTLAVVDGLIGQVPARRYVDSTIGKVVEEHREFMEALPPDELQKYFQDLIIDTEVQAELKWDPLANKAADLQQEAYEKGLVKGMSFRSLSDPDPLRDPDLPVYKSGDLRALKRRIEAFNRVQRIGCEVKVRTPKGEFSETAWVRNFDEPWVVPEQIAENIATILLLKDLLAGA